MPDVFNSNKNEDVPKTPSGKSGETPKASIDNSSQNPEDLTEKNLDGNSVLGGPATGDYHPLSAYIYKPDGLNFVEKEPEEEIYLFLRSHPITNLGWIFMTFVMLIVPAFVSIFSFFEALPLNIKILCYMVWYLLVIAFSFEKFLSWYFHVNLVTNERIIEVDFVNFIYKEVSDANIDKIQEVTVQMGGALKTFFNYGDVLVQTASEIPNIEFSSVPNPDKVAQILRELRVIEENEFTRQTGGV